MKKRVFRILAGSLTLLILLVACAPNDGETAAQPTNGTGDVTAPDEVIEITFITWAEQERLVAQEVLNQRFTEMHPHIRVTMDRPASYREALLAMVAAGTPPDIFFQQEMNPPGDAYQGLMYPLNRFIDADPNFNMDEIFPALFEPFIIDGNVYVIPAITYASILYYNIDMFDAAGLEHPNDDWTWDDYLYAAIRLTQTDDTGRITHFGVTVDRLVNFYLPWIFSNGGDLISPDRSEFVMNSPEASEAIQFLRDLVWLHEVSPTPGLMVEAGVQAFTFQTGVIGMEIMGSWMIPSYDAAGLNYGIAMIPRSPRTGQRVPMAYPNGYAISPGGQNKDAAWMYVSFASSREGQEIMAQAGLGMPTNIQVANSETFLNSSPINLQVVIDSMAIAKGPITTARWGEIDEIIANIGDEIFLNLRDTQEGLDEMKRQVDAIIALITR